MRVLTIITVLLSPLIWTLPVWCHGVEGHIAPGQGCLVTALYDDGEPMGYAAVEIKGPDADVAFQTGRTDRNGLMLFVPDRPGPWQVVVSDGMGHRLVLDLQVAAESFEAPPQSSPPGMAGQPGSTRLQRIAMGLALIFGLFGLLYGWRSRRAHSG